MIAKNNAGLNARWHCGQIRGKQVGEMKKGVAIDYMLLHFFPMPQISEAHIKVSVCSWKAFH